MSLLAVAAILFVAGAAIIAVVAFVPDRRTLASPPPNPPAEHLSERPAGTSPSRQSRNGHAARRRSPSRPER